MDLPLPYLPVVHFVAAKSLIRAWVCLGAVLTLTHPLTATVFKFRALEGRKSWRDHQVTPHLRTTRHPGYLASQRKRKRIEEIFGWFKSVAGLRKTRHRGVARVGWMFTFALAAYNLVRMRNLALAAP
jgi:IS5 family transposase